MVRSLLPIAFGLATVAVGCHLIAGVEDGMLRPGAGGAGGVTVGGGEGGAGAAPGGQGGVGATGGGGDEGGSTGVGGMIEGMINVPGDTFMMGCNDGVDSDCNSDETPYHQVTLSGYRIDMFEVTRSEYNDCIDNGPCVAPTCDFDPMGLPNHPVTCVTWTDAMTYCAYVNKRLPTEAEWEYAARGGDGRRYPWGNKDFDEVIDEMGSPCQLANANLCRKDAEDVGSHPTGASVFGAMDMAGNVAEWVNDRYDENYYAVSPDNDPPGPAMGAVRVLRGGGWNSGQSAFRTSARSANAESFMNDETGFRCAL